MRNTLDDMLATLSAADAGAPAMDVESAVWARIEAADAARRAGPSITVQVAVAVVTLAIGLGVGWSTRAPERLTLNSILSDDYAQYGPLSRLTGGL
jgi:hypothetical protein